MSCWLRSLLIALLFAVYGESRTGLIYSFEPPDLNDWKDADMGLEAAVNCSYSKTGVLVRNPKLDLFTVRLQRYCVGTNEIPPAVPPAQWFNPPKMKCTGEFYYALMVMYDDDYNIECLRVASQDQDSAVASVKFVVMKRFHLKMYFLTPSGDCYLKYFLLPVYECSSSGHIKLPRAKCEVIFPFISDMFVESSDGNSDASVTAVVQPV